jgi:hypothetical protein
MAIQARVDKARAGEQAMDKAPNRAEGVCKKQLCGDIGLVVLSGLGSRQTHPDGVEGTSMARRAPFPLSSIPANIEHLMKLLGVNLKNSIRIGFWTVEAASPASCLT